MNHNELDIWEKYISAYICEPQIIWSGPHADALPLETPIHVITAHNPFEQLLSKDENKRRNESLEAELSQLHVDIKTVIGKSPSGDWQEESFAVHGLTRRQACNIARHFNQRGIYEILEDELLVIEVNTHEIKGRRPRSIEI